VPANQAGTGHTSVGWSIAVREAEPTPSDFPTSTLRVVPMGKRARALLRRVLLALFLVIVLTGLAWDDGGGDSRYLGIDLAVGVGGTAVICGCWWLVKRSVVGAKKALDESFRDTQVLKLKRQQGQYRPRWLPEPSRGAKRTPVVRHWAGRAGRLVGSVQRAYREGRSDGS